MPLRTISYFIHILSIDCIRVTNQSWQIVEEEMTLSSYRSTRDCHNAVVLYRSIRDFINYNFLHNKTTCVLQSLP